MPRAVLLLVILLAAGCGAAAPGPDGATAPASAQPADAQAAGDPAEWVQVVLGDGAPASGVAPHVPARIYRCGRGGGVGGRSVHADEDGRVRREASDAPAGVIAPEAPTLGGSVRWRAGVLTIPGARVRVRLRYREGELARGGLVCVVLGDETSVTDPPRAEVRVSDAERGQDLFVPPGANLVLAPVFEAGGRTLGVGRELRVTAGAAGETTVIDLPVVGAPRDAALDVVVAARGGPAPPCVASLSGRTGLVERWAPDGTTTRLPAGRRELRIEPRDQGPGDFSLPWTGSVDLDAGTRRRLEVELPEGGRLRILLEAEGSETLDLRLAATGSSGTRSLRGGWVRSDSEAPVMSFALPVGEPVLLRGVLPPGRWTLKAHHGRLAAPARTVEVRPGEVHDVRFVFQEVGDR